MTMGGERSPGGGPTVRSRTPSPGRSVPLGMLESLPYGGSNTPPMGVPVSLPSLPGLSRSSSFEPLARSSSPGRSSISAAPVDVFPPSGLQRQSQPSGDNGLSSHPAQSGGLQRSYSPGRLALSHDLPPLEPLGLQRSYSPGRPAQPHDGSYMPPYRDVSVGQPLTRTFSPAGRCRESSPIGKASMLGGNLHAWTPGGCYPSSVSQPHSPVRQRVRSTMTALPEYGGSSVRGSRVNLHSEHASVVFPNAGGIGPSLSPYASSFNSIEVPVPMNTALVGPSVAVGMLRTGSLGQGAA